MSWYDELREQVPNTAAVKMYFDLVEALPGIQAWAPARGLFNSWTLIVHWGLRLDLTKRLAGIQTLHEELAASILSADGPRPDSASELGRLGRRSPKMETRTARSPARRSSSRAR